MPAVGMADLAQCRGTQVSSLNLRVSCRPEDLRASGAACAPPQVVWHDGRLDGRTKRSANKRLSKMRAHFAAAGWQGGSQCPLQWPVVGDQCLGSCNHASGLSNHAPLQVDSLHSGERQRCTRAPKSATAVQLQRNNLQSGFGEPFWPQRSCKKSPALLECQTTSSFKTTSLEGRNRMRKLRHRRFVETSDGLKNSALLVPLESARQAASVGATSLHGVKSEGQSLFGSISHSIDTAPEPSTSESVQSDLLNKSSSGSHQVAGIASSKPEHFAETLAESLVDSNEAAIGAIGGATETGDESGGVNRGDVCSTSLSEHREKYWKGLIDTENWEALHLDRAGSVTDSHVLRRKGHLKVSQLKTTRMYGQSWRATFAHRNIARLQGEADHSILCIAHNFLKV